MRADVAGRSIELTPTEFALLADAGPPAGPRLHPLPAARRGPRRRVRVVRAGDRRPRQEHPPQARARPAPAALHPDGLRRRLSRRRRAAVIVSDPRPPDATAIRREGPGDARPGGPTASRAAERGAAVVGRCRRRGPAAARRGGRGRAVAASAWRGIRLPDRPAVPSRRVRRRPRAVAPGDACWGSPRPSGVLADARAAAPARGARRRVVVALVRRDPARSAARGRRSTSWSSGRAGRGAATTRRA